MVCSRAAAGGNGKSGIGGRHPAVQPGRAGNPERDRAPGVRCAVPTACYLQAAQAVADRAGRGGQVPVSDQLNHAYAVCRGIARRSAKNFYYGFLVLPAEKRNALCAVYAFMRHADDIADDMQIEGEQKRRKLTDWLETANSVFAGQPTDDPVLMALADAQQRFKIPPQLFEKLVEGTTMDLDIPAGGELPAVVCRTFDDLKHYCYYVASIVGLVCIRILVTRTRKRSFSPKIAAWRSSS